jgi:hypothetical protein
MCFPEPTQASTHCACCITTLVTVLLLLRSVLPHPQVHDFWHVLFGCHTNVFGELALKALEFVQVRGGA